MFRRGISLGLSPGSEGIAPKGMIRSFVLAGLDWTHVPGMQLATAMKRWQELKPILIRNLKTPSHALYIDSSD